MKKRYKCSNIENTTEQTRGAGEMTENEKELLRLIRENERPEKALLIAIQVISQQIALHESSGGPFPAARRESF